MTAVLFDMDGVLVDSVMHKHEHRSRALRKDLEIDEVDAEELIGLNVDDKYDYLVEAAGLDVGRDEFVDRFDPDSERVYGEQVDLLEDFEATIEWLAERDVKVGLASAAGRGRVDLVVERFELEDRLDAIVSSDDVAGPSKPDPAIYEAAAAELGVEPSDCVAVEDSEHGVAAATAAGMYCIGYNPPHHPPQDLERADEIVSSPAELHSRIRALVDRGAADPR